MKKYSLVVSILAMCLGVGAAFGGGLPASKASVRTTDTYVIDCEGITAGSSVPGCGSWKTVGELYIKDAGNYKEYLVGGSAVTLLTTLSRVATKQGKKSTAEAEAGIMVRIVMDAGTAYEKIAAPGPVVYDRRLQRLSAILEGQIAACLSADPDTGEISVVDWDCVTPEAIELYQETESAHHFNFVLYDVPVGVHHIEMQAKATNLASTSGECLNPDLDPNGNLDCAAEATAFIGPITLSVEQVQFVKDYTVEF